jgi:FKBP-type peptidyl-prolyl cis-trans isomerase 2
MKSVTIDPSQAYGNHDPEGLRRIPKTSFPEDFETSPGVMIQGEVGDQQVRGTITEVIDDFIVVDFNHPMAGKNLNFEIELVDVN